MILPHICAFLCPLANNAAVAPVNPPSLTIELLEKPRLSAIGLAAGRVNDRLGSMSLDPVLQSIYPPMSKPKDRSTLYRLIEAGQLAHQALLAPLVDRGLDPGDDAVLFVLHAQLGGTAETLAAELGLSLEALEPRLARLIERDIVARRAIGPELAPGLALTERGERIREILAANWQQLEDALFGDLAPKKRKPLDKALKRFVALLRL